MDEEAEGSKTANRETIVNDALSFFKAVNARVKALETLLRSSCAPIMVRSKIFQSLFLTFLYPL